LKCKKVPICCQQNNIPQAGQTLTEVWIITWQP
jgi:hypothetical protein